MEREIHAELQAHMEMRAEDNVRLGMSPTEARRDAIHRFGNPALIRERTALEEIPSLLERLWMDMRYALRQLRRSPRFTLVAVASLALGIGATSTIYSVIHAVLIDPYPYRDADRIVHLHLYDTQPMPLDLALTGPQFIQFQKSPVLDGAIAEDIFSSALTGEDLPQQIQLGRLSPNAFQFFGVPALFGREFGPSDSSRVAVLSYRFWKAHYQGRPDVVGSSLQLDREDYTVIGVLPQRFAWSGRDVYVPLQYSPDPHRIATIFARVSAGVSYPVAERGLEPLLHGFARERPENFPQKFKVHFVRINDIATGRFKGTLVILFVSVFALLMLACVNVAILLLARGEARQPEIAMRKALGASRSRIIEQLLVEGSVLAFLGGLIGILAAAAGIHLVRRYLPQSTFPAEAEIALNLPVLFFSIGLSILSGIGAALRPAFRASLTTLRRATDATSLKVIGQRHVRRSHMALFTGQVALTVVLLAASAATLRNLWQVVHADLGYDPQDLMSVSLTLRDGAYPRWLDRVNYYEQIRRQISSQPGVGSVAIVEGRLPPALTGTASFSIPGDKAGPSRQVLPQGVSSRYFSTMGIRLLRGRVWSDAETVHADHVAVINEATRRRYWPNTDPIGRTFVLNNGIVAGNVWTLVAPGNNGTYQVIGVVADSPNQGLDEPVAPAVYLPYTMRAWDWFNLVIRTQTDPGTLLHAIREKVHGIDSDQAVGDVKTANDMLEEASLGRDRFVAWLFMTFACLALSFSAFGLYSILSYLVIRRTREFGVRMALGAQRRHIARLVLAGSSIATAAGISIGLLVDSFCSHTFAEWTHGNSRDPLVLSFVVLLLLVVAFAASLLPARAAMFIDPMQAIRSE
jgi:putative ABC transport system permease protein